MVSEQRNVDVDERKSRGPRYGKCVDGTGYMDAFNASMGSLVVSYAKIALVVLTLAPGR